MEARRREQARSALRLVAPDAWSDDDLAAAFDGHLAAAEASAYLAGFLLQVLATQRGERVADTARYVAALLDRGDDGDDGGGVREPRRPAPTSGFGQEAAEIPADTR